MDDKDPSLLSEFLAGMRRVLSERLVSPLFPAFAIAWLGTNYKFVMTIFSDDTLAQKFAVIDALFPTWQVDALQGGILPLLIALAYILIYPYPAKWVYAYALWRQRELLRTRQESEEARLLTKEESDRLRAYYYDQRRQFEGQLRERTELIEELNAKISALENTRVPSQTRREGTITSHDDPLSAPSGAPRGVLTALERKVLKALSDIENEQPSGTLTSVRQLVERIKGVDTTDMKIALENLSRKKLIEGSDNYRLTHEGRVAVKERPSSAPI